MRLQRMLFYVCVAFTVTGLFAGGAAFAGEEREPLELLNTVSLTGGDLGIGGLAPGGSDLYTGATFPDPYETDFAGYHFFNPVDGSIITSGAIPGSYNQTHDPAGMASNGSYLYQGVFSGESGVSGIVKYTPGVPAVIDDVYQFQGTEAEARAKGLTHDGKFIWQAHYSPEAGCLYAIDPATGDRVNTLFVDPYPYGLAYDGKYFWVAHHNPVSHTSYIAKYDRSEDQLATYALPTSMSPDTALGDLAVEGDGLFAHVLGTSNVAHFTLPVSSQTPPAMGSGVTAVSVSTHAGIEYDGRKVTDTQAATDYTQLPIAASVERSSSGSAMDVAGLARSYYDEAGVHNVVASLAYGDGYSSEVQGAGVLVINKELLITPHSCGLAAGTVINATGSLTFDGLLQAKRNEGADATGLVSELLVKVTKTGPGNEVVCFDGTISLLGQGTGDDWVRTLLAGDADTAALQEACNGVDIGADFASLELNSVRVGFSVSAIVGQTFYVKILLHTDAYIPAWADGLGAEVAFGMEGELHPEYSVGGDPEAYDDGYGGGAWDGWTGDWHTPEPSSMIMLLTGGLIALRRRKNKAVS